ncbi:putative methyl-accepting chemotaxis protein [Yersinia frederiksenii]|nr:putative methyl-accepting chemotaxis protein [Yersinia frederiksenii]
MLSIISVKKMVRFYLYIIVFLFIVIAVLSVRSSNISRENFDNTLTLHKRVKLLDEAMYKLMDMRGDILTMKMESMTNQGPNLRLINVVTNNNKRVRTITSQWVNESKSSPYAQELSEKSNAIFLKILDNFMLQINNQQISSEIINDTNELIKQLEPLVTEYLNLSDSVMTEYDVYADYLHYTLLITLGVISVFFILLYFSLLRYITRNILNRLSEASQVFAEISTGVLSKKVPQYGTNEIGQLFSNIEAMRKSLAEIITGVKEAVINIKHNSVEISEGNNDLSSRTEEQASALQETAASMEQIKTTVENNTSHAHEANKLATDTKSMADSGSEIMVDVVHSMDTIASHANQISNIIKVIDGIASQTNILALNAAVEAARAGEQGRGFAVVATEVRNLAQRSADAAKEIRGLIERSVQDTQAGSKRVDNAKNTMFEIVAMVSKVSEIMQDISQASEEQTMGIRQVAVAINEMDIVTQQNSTLVEESAAITALMNEQTTILEDIVSVFQVEGENQQA